MTNKTVSGWWKVGPRGASRKTKRASLGRKRTGGLKHQVTMYILPRRHVAPTAEHQFPRVNKSNKRGTCWVFCFFFTALLLQHCLTTNCKNHKSSRLTRTNPTFHKFSFMPVFTLKATFEQLELCQNKRQRQHARVAQNRA